LCDVISAIDPLGWKASRIIAPRAITGLIAITSSWVCAFRETLSAPPARPVC
jgi:hypothetical protein